jgi:hypothetical protein
MSSARRRGDGGQHWWEDCGEIARLLRYLESEDGLDVTDAIEIVSTPWSWDFEYQEMCRVQAGPDLAVCDEDRDALVKGAS